MRVRIISLNFNGLPLLEKCLPSLVQAANASKSSTQVTVLDNGSTDQSEAWVRKAYPSVEWAKAPINKVLCSYNDYLKTIPDEIAILLNNDIRVDAGFVDPLVQKFEQNPGTFMVAPKVMDFEGGKIEAAKTIAQYKWGIYGCSARYTGYENEADVPATTESSGFGAFDRKIFLELGGYDERYLPGIMEDVDLCYQAKKRGYRLYYEPRSVVYHMGQATFKKIYGKDATARIAHRNTFLFMWKNLHGFKFWFTQAVFIPLRILAAFLKGNFSFIEGFFDALKYRIL